MKVKLLKRIRKRFCIVPVEHEIYNDIYKHTLFDIKTSIEHNIYGDVVEGAIRKICYCLDNPFFRYSSWFDSKIEKRKNTALRKKYFPFLKK